MPTNFPPPICTCEFIETNQTLTLISTNDTHEFTNVGRSILVAFSGEETELGECTKSSMSHKVHQQDQYISVRRPHIYVSQSGVTDGINYMQRNHSVCLLMIVSRHQLSQGVGMIDLNCGTFHDHHLLLRSFIFLQ